MAVPAVPGSARPPAQVTAGKKLAAAAVAGLLAVGVAAEVHTPAVERPDDWRASTDRALGWFDGRTSLVCRGAFYGPEPADSYCGRSTDGLQRDHMVAWGEALDSGARAWTRSRQLDYFNAVPNLYVLDARTNDIKSDKDPAEWRPADESVWCRYATEWAAVKATWGLTVDRAERAALTEMLGRC